MKINFLSLKFLKNFLKFFKNILIEIREWFEFIINNFPGNSGFFFRKHYYKNLFKGNLLNCRIQRGFIAECKRNIFFGANVYIGFNCKIFASSNSKIVIGDKFTCNSNVMINSRGIGEIKIGKNVLIGPNSVLRSNNHNFKILQKPINQQGMSEGKIIIEDDVWIGSNVVILPNVIIGKGSIVAAGAVVTSKVKSFSIVGGVPAKEIGMRS
tara:strand:- start:9581 stop:10213 length:633 start_codon:yes stop_codon:yes gene_type:complete